MGGRGASSGAKKKKVANAMDTFDNLPKDIKEAVFEYSTDGYSINGDLRRGEWLNPSKRGFVDAIDEAINLGELKEDTVVYRGVASSAFGITGSKNFNNDDFVMIGDIEAQLKTKIGKTFTDKGFMSTSIDRNVAIEFADYNTGDFYGVILEMKAKKGTNAIYIGGDKGGYADEKELLFGRGKNFTIKDVRNQNGYIMVSCDFE